MPDKLLFVDTNIWLDFYRVRNDVFLHFVQHLDTIRDKIITTYVVEMEFKKNRQGIIYQSIKDLKISEYKISPPPLLSDAATVRKIRKSLETAKSGVRILQDRLMEILTNPGKKDDVYKVAQRCFHRDDAITLSRETPTKRHIQRKAFKRFLHGCPPRKDSDTSIGDSINWEWIIDCANRKNAEIHIITRDSDYGVVTDRGSIINDHLSQEFKDRVSQKRKIFLHGTLSNALKHFQIKITDQDEKSEQEAIATLGSLQGGVPNWADYYVHNDKFPVSSSTITETIQKLMLDSRAMAGNAYEPLASWGLLDPKSPDNPSKKDKE